MNANIVLAICATAIAIASLGVSVYAAWATREHNRLSVRPLLGLAASFRHGETAGLLLSNRGLGPAKITNTKLTHGDKQIGEFSQPNIDQLTRTLPFCPRATALGDHPFLGEDYEKFLLSIDRYDPTQHHWFKELINNLKIEIQYESIYGGKRFTVAYPPPTLQTDDLIVAWRSAETISLGMIVTIGPDLPHRRSTCILPAHE